MEISTPEIFTLFPSVVCKFIIQEDISDLNKIKNYDWRVVSNDYNYSKTLKTQVTENLYVLEDFPKEKNIIQEYF